MKQENTEKRIRNEHINELLGGIAPDSWLIFPRYINSLLRAGIITATEYNVYCYLRNDCNVYGFAVTSVANIRNDIFPRNKGITPDWINKILRTLKSKEIIYYKDRTGVAGSFEVWVDDFLLPSGQYSSLKNKAANRYIVGESGLQTDGNAYLKIDSLTYAMGMESTTKPNNYDSDRNTVVGNNNDKDTKNDNNTVSVSNKGKEYRCTARVKDFVPRSYEETKALEIANSLGEVCMDSYISLIKNGNFWALEKAYDQYRESNISPDNPAAYVNSIIQRLIITRAKEKIGKVI